MDPIRVVIIISCYFLVLIGIAALTSKGADTKTFFTANRQSPWYLVAFGMIGTSLSGVTFISVPGWVASSQFSYMQMVLGYLVGYFIIATVLLPLYYRLQLISIYAYLEQRFGFFSYKTGAFFFLLSRTIGAAFRLFLVVGVLQLAVFDAWGVPFEITVLIALALIWLYTFKGGIKTIVWTDTLQTVFMLVSVVLTIFLIKDALGQSWQGLVSLVSDSGYSKIFVWDPKPANNFFKQFLSGAFIAIVMIGLDQDMMQKNLTCRNVGEAQKNIFWFSIVLVFVNFIFLFLGALLYVFANKEGLPIPAKADHLFPVLALNHLNGFAAILFILGITAAAYSSADSALTALTTSFCVDFLGFTKKNVSQEHEGKNKKIRFTVHIVFSLLLFGTIIVFKTINNASVISDLFKAAGYTYGPLLGLYAFGLFTKMKVKDKLVPMVCIASPILSFLLNSYSDILFWGYKIGFEVLIVNGLLTFFGLYLISEKNSIVPLAGLKQ